MSFTKSLDKAFFDAAREDPFDGHLTPGQVTGLTSIITLWNAKYSGHTVEELAYCLATTFHETAQTMQPIEEYGKGRGHAYGDAIGGHAYYGRGYVQLTWLKNYETMGELLGVDLVNHPELALDPTVAGAIMFEGMIRGTFTGRKLSAYFNPTKKDAVGARRIINGSDRASTIAGYYGAFLDALVPG